MPKYCAAIGCKSSGSMPLRKFYRFPMINSLSQKTLALTKTRQDLWLLALNRANFLPSSYKNATVCDLHFLSGKSAKYTDVGNADWVPSINMGYKKLEKRMNRINQIKNELNQQEKSKSPFVERYYAEPTNIGEGFNADLSSTNKGETQTEFLQCIQTKDDVNISRQHENQFNLPFKCSVEHCQNSTWNRRVESTTTFHLFPKADKLKSIWKAQIQLGNKQTKIDDRGAVCSAHFKTTDFINTKQKIVLRSFAVPTKFPNLSVKEEEEEEDEQEIVAEDYMLTHTNDNIYDGNHFEIQDYIRHSSTEDSQDGSQYVNDDDTTNCAFTDTEYDHHTEIEFVDIWSPPSKPNKKNNISRYAACQNAAPCQSKINAQAKEICRLKQLAERQSSKIKFLEEVLLEKSRESFMRSSMSSASRINLEETLLRIPLTTVVKLKRK